MKTIDEHGREHLEGVIAETEQCGEGTADELRKVWERDVTGRKEFFEDQKRNCKLFTINQTCRDLII